MTVSQALLKAAEHLEQHGWIQDGYGKPNTPCCMLGAIHAVVGLGAESATFFGARLRVRLWLTAMYGPSPDGHLRGPFTWNDDPNRTKDEVLAALRGAAAAEPTP